MEMDIGTAKPDWSTRFSPIHHMIDITTPDTNFSVALYQEMARNCIKEIKERDKIPLVVGGTPMYVTALLCNIEIPPGTLDSDLRKRLVKLAKKDPEKLWEKLEQVDPDAIELIQENNLRRVIRAIEIYTLTGKKYSQLRKNWNNRELVYNTNIFALIREREEIYKRINRRVDLMVQKGLFEETEHLKEKWNLSKTALQALGYKEALSYIKGDISKDEAVELIKKRTRRFAKRQLSWFRNDKFVTLLDISGLTDKEAAEKILNRQKIS